MRGDKVEEIPISKKNGRGAGLVNQLEMLIRSIREGHATNGHRRRRPLGRAAVPGRPAYRWTNGGWCRSTKSVEHLGGETDVSPCRG